MRVFDVGGAERGCEFVGVELRNVAGFGDGSDVDEMADVVSMEERDELFDGVGGVADGEEDIGCHRSIVVPMRVLKMKSRFFAHHPRTFPKELALFGVIRVHKSVTPGAFGALFSQNDRWFDAGVLNGRC